MLLFNIFPIVRNITTAVTLGAKPPNKAFPGCNGINLLLLGRDVDRDKQGRITKSLGRTDTIVLTRFDFRDKSLRMLWIPRDILVEVPGYPRERRINTANKLGGPKLAQKTVFKLLNVEINHYILVNFQGFEKLIDSLGGVRVNVDKALDYDDNAGNLHIHLKPGIQVLNGRQAIEFVRYRRGYNDPGESYTQRIYRQKELIFSILEKLLHPLIIIRIPRALSIARGSMEMDLTPGQVLCLIRFVSSMQSSNIRMDTLPADFEDEGLAYLRMDNTRARKVVKEMFVD